jgi:hypothetical protein
VPRGGRLFGRDGPVRGQTGFFLESAKGLFCGLTDRAVYHPRGERNVSPPKRLKKQEAREALPEELRGTFDKLCEETLHWSQYYYGTNFISYSILKELVEDGWVKHPSDAREDLTEPTRLSGS